MRHSEAVDKTTIQDQAAEVERLEGIVSALPEDEEVVALLARTTARIEELEGIVSKAESAMTSALHTEGNWRAHLTGYFAAAEQAKGDGDETP